MIDIFIVLGLLALAIVLFAREVFSVDIVTLLLLIALVVLGYLSPAEAFSGFSSDIIIILASIFVLSGALQHTGVIDAIGSRLLKIAGQSAGRLLLVIMGTAGGFSAFMNNTTATALFVGPVLSLARNLRVSASKLLIPLAYASILGGTCTLIGTSTNVAVSLYITKAGLEPLHLFEMTKIGIIILGTGMIYMLLVGRHLLPDHPDQSLAGAFALKEYLSEIIVVPNSHMIGQRMFESDLARMDFRILEVIRNKRRFPPDPNTLVEANDVLIVNGNAAELLKVKAAAGIEIRPEIQHGDRTLQSAHTKIAEVLIHPRSELIGHTLKELDFRRLFGLTVLAISRHGQSLKGQLGRVRLRMGDLLLVQGTPAQLSAAKNHHDVTLLEELNPSLYRRKKGVLVAAFFGVAVVLGGLGVLPLSIAFLLAAVLTVMVGAITPEEAYEFVDWRLLILIGGMTAFGKALENTGAAEFLAENIVQLLAPLGVMTILAGFFLLTILLTQAMSNAAAALVVLPVALTTARELGVNERTFAIAIMLAASISLIAPLEPACVLVYGPGKYRFSDFIKTGVGLTLMLMVVVLALIPVFWPL